MWNNPNIWSDIVIHLGDFHAMMTFFRIIGLFVEGSGFEDAIFQSGLCSSGSISGVMNGRHYNRCWLIHEAFSEALERLFLEQYLPTIPENVEKFAQSAPEAMRWPDIQNDDAFKEFAHQYKALKVKCLSGEFGKTPQFWAKYMKLVDCQQQLQFSINTNAYDLIHYARYGTYYVSSLEHIDSTHPGAKEEIGDMGLSVRGNTLGIGQAIDLAGEQSYMRNAKAAGKSQFMT